MNNETNKTAVPKLRFPEFREAGAWERKKLGELFAERQESGFIELPLLSLTDKEGIIPQEESNRRNTSNSDKKKYLKVCVGDVAYNTMRMWEGRSAFVTMEGIISPAYTVCKPKLNVHSRFFSYYFKTRRLVEEFHRYSQGLVKDTLNLKFTAFSQISTFVPTQGAEQQKIAATLSSLDDLLTAQTAKLTALQAHKRGLMQQLFPAAGETVPKRRFAEFEWAGEWAEKPVSDALSYESSAISQGGLKLVDGGYPVYGASGLVGRIANYAQEDDYISILKDGAGVGRLELYAGKSSVLGTLGYLKPQNSDEYDLVWLFHLLQTINFFEYVSGSTIPHIYYSNYSKHIVAVPSLAEQQKIAACLSSLDDLITAQTQKIEALKRHKQGLMQGLFPAAADNNQ